MTAPVPDTVRTSTTGARVAVDDAAARGAGVARRGLPRPRPLLVAFLPALAAGVALAVHRWMPNQQITEISGRYAAFLQGIIVAGVVLGVTQRLWRPADLSWRRPIRLPFAALSNVMRWAWFSAC